MARKRKFKADNLTGLWKRLDEVVPPFLSAKVKERGHFRKKLTDIVTEVNDSPIPGAIAQSMVRPYFPEDGEISVAFMASGKDNFGKHTVWIEEAGRQVGVDPVGLYLFREELMSADKSLAKVNPKADNSFNRFRDLSFFREVAKLPRQYLIFIAVLREIAQAARIVAVEKRDGGYADADSPKYLSLLWAFKEFEQFYQRSQHRDLRADYGIIWHEGQWVDMAPLVR